MISCNKVTYLLRECLDSISKISVPGLDTPRHRRWGSQLPESPWRHWVQYIDRYVYIYIFLLLLTVLFVDCINPHHIPIDIYVYTFM